MGDPRDIGLAPGLRVPHLRPQFPPRSVFFAVSCSGVGYHVLCGVGLVVHEEQLDVLDVADEEGLVARGHHVAGLLVGAIADLEAVRA